MDSVIWRFLFLCAESRHRNVTLSLGKAINRIDLLAPSMQHAAFRLRLRQYNRSSSSSFGLRHDLTILVSLSTLHVNHYPFAIDVADLQMGQFRPP